jgi:hypothetical protein
MKTQFLAAAAAMLLLTGAAQAQTVSNGQTVHAGQAMVVVTAKAPRPTAAPGLPSYELRPDGLLINGLMPADGEQG